MQMLTFMFRTTRGSLPLPPSLLTLISERPDTAPSRHCCRHCRGARCCVSLQCCRDCGCAVRRDFDQTDTDAGEYRSGYKYSHLLEDLPFSNVFTAPEPPTCAALCPAERYFVAQVRWVHFCRHLAHPLTMCCDLAQDPESPCLEVPKFALMTKRTSVCKIHTERLSRSLEKPNWNRHGHLLTQIYQKTRKGCFTISLSWKTWYLLYYQHENVLSTFSFFSKNMLFRVLKGHDFHHLSPLGHLPSSSLLLLLPILSVRFFFLSLSPPFISSSSSLFSSSHPLQFPLFCRCFLHIIRPDFIKFHAILCIVHVI